MKTKSLKKICWCLCYFSITYSSNFIASDLIDIYKLAERNDAIIQQAREVYLSKQEEKNITRGALLPNITLYAGRGLNRITHIAKPLHFYNKYYDLRLEQILFDWAKWNTYLRTEPLITSAEKTLYTANQDLIIRVSEAYFNILAAQDNILYYEKQYEATNELLQQANARLEVGAITIADVDQVKADLASANAYLIETRNDLANAREKLREIIYVNVPEIAKLNEKISLPDVSPKSLNAWLELSKKYNLDMQVANANRQVANKDISIAEGDFLPTAKFTTRLRGSDGRLIRDAAFISQRQFVNFWYMNVEVTSPNLNPYGAIAKTDQARALYHVADEKYIEAYRKAQMLIAQYYRSLSNGKEQIKALNQAIKSSNIALDSNKANFQLGTRTYVIILQNISDLYRVQRDYKLAIYEYLLNLLKIENAAGRLDIQDLAKINQLLTNVSNRFNQQVTEKSATISNNKIKISSKDTKDNKLNVSLDSLKLKQNSPESYEDIPVINPANLSEVDVKATTPVIKTIPKILKTHKSYQPYRFDQIYNPSNQD